MARGWSGLKSARWRFWEAAAAGRRTSASFPASIATARSTSSQATGGRRVAEAVVPRGSVIAFVAVR